MCMHASSESQWKESLGRKMQARGTEDDLKEAEMVARLELWSRVRIR